MEPTLDHIIDDQLIVPAAGLERPVGTTSLAGRAAFAGPVVATCTVAAALVTTQAAGVGLRDLDHVALRRFVVTVAILAAMAGLDLAVSASRRRAWAWRQRWTPRRVLIVA